MKSWVKIYTEINRDPKIFTMTPSQRGIFMSLIALAGEIDARNEDGAETGELDTVEYTALRARFDIDEFKRDLIELEKRGLVDEDQDGILYIPRYSDRQKRKPSDQREAVAERVKRHREKLAKARNAFPDLIDELVTPSNALTVTASHPVTRTDPDPDPDPDPDSDTDSDSDPEDDKPGEKNSPATAEPAPPKREGIRMDQGKVDPKQGLRLDQAPGGLILAREFEIARKSKGLPPFRYYANNQQRDAYLKVYQILNGELQPLIEKGLERQRESLSMMLAWLQGCVKKSRPALKRPGMKLTPDEAADQLLAYGVKP